MSMLYLILSVVVLMLQASRACNEQNVQQLASTRLQSDEYAYGADGAYDAYGYTPNPWVSSYYQPTAHVPGYANPYERRNPLNRQPNYNPFQKYFTSNDYGTDANARTLFRIFRCPTCPTCPSPVVCPTCPTCPAIPAACPGTTNAADPISITINGASACTKASTGADNFGTGGCTRVTAAPTGVFTVSFTGGANNADPYPTAFIGIVATCPNTKVTVKCGTFTTAVVTTQTKAIPSGGSATETGSAMITVGRGNQAIDSVSCSWTSSV